MSSSLGIAILGAGIFAKQAHLPALSDLGNKALPLKAVYSRSEQSARDFADEAQKALGLPAAPDVYFDASAQSLDALLSREDIVAVVVVLPINTQPSIIRRALEAGKHVLSEKPVAPDVLQGLELIKKYNRLYKPKGLIWRVAENFEAEVAYRTVRSYALSGKIGTIVSFKATVINYIDQHSQWYKTAWRTVPDYQGGFLLDGGVHTIAALRVMLPEPLSEVSAFSSLTKDYLAPHDTVHAIVKAGHRIYGSVDLTWAHPTKSRPEGADGFLITGTKGWISVRQLTHPGADAPILRVLIKTRGLPGTGVLGGGDGAPEVEESEEVLEFAVEGVARELESFFLAVSGNDDGLGLGDPLAALQDVAFIEAALNSNGVVADLEKVAEGRV